MNIETIFRRAAGCILVAIAALTLSSCGFKLRGSGADANIPFKTVHISLAETSPLGAELRRYIGAGKTTTIVPDPKAAQAIVDVLSLTRDREVLSLNSQGRVREHALLYSATFRVRGNNGAELLAPTQIVVKRSISFNESQVLAKEAEEAALYRDMQNDMVRQMLRKIAALKPPAQ